MRKKIVIFITVLIFSVLLAQCGLFDPVSDVTLKYEVPVYSLDTISVSGRTVTVDAHLLVPNPCFYYSDNNTILSEGEYYIYVRAKYDGNPCIPQTDTVLSTFSLQFETSGSKALHFWNGTVTTTDTSYSTFIDTTVLIP